MEDFGNLREKNYTSRREICHMFYTNKITIFLIYPGKRVNRGIFGKDLRMEDVSLIDFEQIVRFLVKSYNKTTLA